METTEPTSENNEFQAEQATSFVYPPKPEIVERNDQSMVRSLLSLFLYGVLFYFIFDQNIAYIAAILVVLLIHESGHFLFMKLFKYNNVRIFIVPLLGAFTSGVKQKVSQLQMSLIILGGPVPGIIIGCVLLYLNQEMKNENLQMLANTFLVINLLNLLPMHPLDGGRMIETLFFRENYIIRMVFGIISMMGLSGLALWQGNLILLIIPFMIGLELFNESKFNKIRAYLSGEKIQYRVEYKDLPDKDYWLIRDCLIFSFPKKYGMLSAGRYEYTVFEPALISHVKAVLQTNLVQDLPGFKKILMLLVYLFALFAPIFFLIQLYY